MMDSERNEKQTQPLEKWIDTKLNYFPRYRKPSVMHRTIIRHAFSFVLFLYPCPVRNKADSNSLDCFPPLVITSGEVTQLCACLSSMHTKLEQHSRFTRLLSKGDRSLWSIPYFFLNNSIIIIIKPGKNTTTTTKKLQTNIPDEHRCRKPP